MHKPLHQCVATTITATTTTTPTTTKTSILLLQMLLTLQLQLSTPSEWHRYTILGDSTGVSVLIDGIVKGSIAGRLRFGADFHTTKRSPSTQNQSLHTHRHIDSQFEIQITTQVEEVIIQIDDFVVAKNVPVIDSTKIKKNNHLTRSLDRSLFSYI